MPQKAFRATDRDSGKQISDNRRHPEALGTVTKEQRSRQTSHNRR